MNRQFQPSRSAERVSLVETCARVAMENKTATAIKNIFFMLDFGRDGCAD